MLIIEILVVALRGIFANKTRTMLTMLGIVVGVGSVIILMAFSEGTRRELLRRFDEWGANRMGVWLDKWNKPVDVPESENLRPSDVWAILDQCSMITSAVPVADTRVNVRYGNTTLDDHSLVATEPDYFKISNLSFSQGRAFNDEENVLSERVCVLGSNTKFSLFFAVDAVDEFVIIEGKRFRVVGVMEEKGGPRWARQDDQVIIPFRTGRDRMTSLGSWMTIQMTVIDPELSEFAEKQVREVLHLEHPLVPLTEDPEEDPFDIWNIAERQQEREQTANTLSTFLVVMGALALFIGGVGVMNIMLVTVQERTREIGLRKALGASSSVILLQFLLESVVICLLGGTLGTLFAVVGCRYMAKLPDEMQMPDPIITHFAIIIAVAVTVTVGLFFGVYPATRAARLDPISALHSE